VVATVLALASASAFDRVIRQGCVCVCVCVCACSTYCGVGGGVGAGLGFGVGLPSIDNNRRSIT
jgi:hypothetical protein